MNILWILPHSLWIYMCTSYGVPGRHVHGVIDHLYFFFYFPFCIDLWMLSGRVVWTTLFLGVINNLFLTIFFSLLLCKDFLVLTKTSHLGMRAPKSHFQHTLQLCNFVFISIYWEAKCLRWVLTKALIHWYIKIPLGVIECYIPLAK